MAASTWQQTWYAYRYANNELVLIGPDATGWTLSFEIATSPVAVPTLSITPTIATTTVTIPLTYAQMTTTLTENEYPATLWRTDSGSRKPLASGTLILTILPHATP